MELPEVDSLAQGAGVQSPYFFLSLSESVDMALSRVRDRVLKGGHDVPEPVVRRRFGARSRTSSLSIARWLIPGIYLITRARPPPVIAFETAGKLRRMSVWYHGTLTARYGDK